VTATQVPLSGTAAMLIGLAALAVVAMTFQKVGGIRFKAYATGGEPSSGRTSQHGHNQ